MTTLTLFCVISGQHSSQAFPVEISCEKTVGALRDAITANQPLIFNNIPANHLVLWKAVIPVDENAEEESVITLDGLDKSFPKKLGPTLKLSNVFGEEASEGSIHVLVQLPKAPKRDREEDTVPSPKKTRLYSSNLMDAIKEVGLSDKAVVDNMSDLSLLDSKENVSVIGFLGSGVDKTNSYYSLSTTALALRKSSFQDLEVLSTPPGSNTLFPVVNTEDLYVRQAYKDLYDEITLRFQESTRNRALKRIVVTGTSGIGKSAFLVYFTIRLLATASDDNPPIVIFQMKGGSKCRVYGGLSTVRQGDIDDFLPFLSLPETWYLVDSSPNPRLERAKTVISASPKTLFSDNQYQEVDKRVPWRYYMAPWMLEELKQCWGGGERFQVVPKALMEELYGMIGGVPRYVLEKPKDVLSLDPSDTTGARESACERVLQAVDLVQAPLRMMQCFEQGRESLEHSSLLLHRWPTDNHKGFRLAWASAYIADKIDKSLQDVTWQQILEKLTGVGVGTAKGPMFELYVRHIFRKGGYQFQLKDLQDGTDTTFEIPANPRVEFFKEISAVPPGTLCIPTSCTYACIDLLLSPEHLIQITVSRRHDIKGPPFSKLLENLQDKGWIQSSAYAHLVFVVPSEVYDNFPEQKYLSATGTVYKSIPQPIQQVRQFALKIDLKSASTGKSPGICGPAY